MFSSNTSVSNKVVGLADYIDRSYCSIEELAESLNEKVTLDIAVSTVLQLLSIKGLVVLGSQFGHRLTEDARRYTTRKYTKAGMQILWKRSLVDDITNSDLIEFFKR